MIMIKIILKSGQMSSDILMMGISVKEMNKEKTQKWRIKLTRSMASSTCTKLWNSMKSKCVQIIIIGNHCLDLKHTNNKKW